MDEDDVILNHYTTLLEELETTKINSDVRFVNYKATTPSFSFFAISVKEKIVPEIVEEESEANITKIEEGNETKTTEIEEIGEGTIKKDYSLLIAVVVFILIVMGYFGYWKKRNKKEQITPTKISK